MNAHPHHPPGLHVMPEVLEHDRALRSAALVYAGGVLVHTADHFRRGLDVLTPEVLWVGSASTTIVLLVIAAALAGHRLAAPLAALVGFSHAFGVAAVHLLPQWSALSDAFPASHVDALSWTAVLVEIAAALAFATTGALIWRTGHSR